MPEQAAKRAKSAASGSGVSQATAAGQAVTAARDRLGYLRLQEAQTAATKPATLTFDTDLSAEEILASCRLDASIESAEAELRSAVQAPVCNGVDPTLWLPDELLVLVLSFLDDAYPCLRVCRRWHAVCQQPVLQRRLWQARWGAYASGARQPQEMKSVFASGFSIYGRAMLHNIPYAVAIAALDPKDGTTEHVRLSLCAFHDAPSNFGPDGKMYTSGTKPSTRSGLGPGFCITVWANVPMNQNRPLCEEDPKIIRALVGHPGMLTAIAVTRHVVYAGGTERSLFAWSALDNKGDIDGEHEVEMRHPFARLVGHTDGIETLCVVGETLLCSGSEDTSIRVWNTAPPQVHEYSVLSRPLRTLKGHTGAVNDLAQGLRGELVSASSDKSVCVWNPTTGDRLRCLDQVANILLSVAVGRDGSVFAGAVDGTLYAWRDGNRTPGAVINTPAPGRYGYDADEDLLLSVFSLEFSSHGTLYSAHYGRAVLEW